VIFGRFSTRTRAWINLAGACLFLIPFCAVVLAVSWPSVLNSWQVLEMSPDPGGLPRYPIKTMILVAFVLLMAQGVSEVIKQIAFLRGVISDPDEPLSRQEGV
jgi:TRAP-type mannitol/chloroaromatic compound transport system permease small subunit